MKKTKKRTRRNSILVVDCNAICHYVKYSATNLSYDGMGTGIIYGFLSKILNIQSRVRAGYISFCWDDLASKRRDIFPPYKEKRNSKEKTEEEMAVDQACYNQFNQLRKTVLHEIGFQNIHHTPGLEGDDLIASVCQSNLPKIIVARDGDLFQLLDQNTTMYDYQTEKTFTHKDFRRTWGIRPDRWAEAKAYGGCSTDEVPGIPIPNEKGGWSKRGVGPKTAIKFINGKLGTHTKAFKAIESEHGRKIYKRNFPLVKLPFEGTPQIEIKLDQLWWKNFEFVCLKYGFDSFLSTKAKRKWQVAFKMED